MWTKLTHSQEILTSVLVKIKLMGKFKKVFLFLLLQYSLGMGTHKETFSIIILFYNHWIWGEIEGFFFI